MIETDAALVELLSQVKEGATVMVDTEFMRRNTFFPQSALLQLCFDDGPVAEKAWLIDPLKIEDTTPIVALLTEPTVLKVLHSPSEDLEVFQHWLGTLPSPLFDTQRAAALLGIGFGLGYRKLVQILCDVELPKGETRSNWLQRPLTDSQCEYAALDVSWLLQIWRQLHARCCEQGKLQWVLDDGRDALAHMPAQGYHRKIKSAWKLDRRQLGILQTVCDWRERIAREKDKPRSWIIDDKACLQLAQNDPATPQALRGSVEMPAPAARRYAADLLDLLAQQRTQPDSCLPERLPRPLTPPQREAVKSLKANVKNLAESLGASPEILLQGKDYELLVRLASGETISAPHHWSGWRRDTVIQPLQEILGSRQ